MTMMGEVAAKGSLEREGRGRLEAACVHRDSGVRLGCSS